MGYKRVPNELRVSDQALESGASGCGEPPGDAGELRFEHLTIERRHQTFERGAGGEHNNGLASFRYTRCGTDPARGLGRRG